MHYVIKYSFLHMHMFDRVCGQRRYCIVPWDKGLDLLCSDPSNITHGKRGKTISLNFVFFMETKEN